MVWRAHRRTAPAAATPRTRAGSHFTERLRWLLSDPATQRDLRWTAPEPGRAWILAGLSAAIIVTGLIEFIGPELTREIKPPTFPGNAAGTLIVLGLALSRSGCGRPRRLAAYGRLAR